MITVAYDLNMKGYPAPLSAIQPHLCHITEITLDRADNTAATLSTNLGYHLQMMGDYAAARPITPGRWRFMKRSWGRSIPILNPPGTRAVKSPAYFFSNF
jgi:hypothetical protein